MKPTSENQHTDPSGRALIWILVMACSGALGASAMWLVLRPAAADKALSAPSEKASAESRKTRYQCPMHPTIVQDHPGDCPICGMKLVPMQESKDQKTGSSPPTGERKILYYRSPMDPKVTSPMARKDEMGMAYVPVYEDEVSGTGGIVKGRTVVTIDPARQQLIGLRTTPVTRSEISGAWQTVGRVQVDPTQVRKMNVKISGYIEKIYVDFVGRAVRRGEPLFSFYSPELLSAQREYLLALKTREALGQGGALADNGEAMVASARKRLELWDVPAAEIERIERNGELSKTLTFSSPTSGVVTAKNVVEGSFLRLGDTPYEITDLSRVWVLADAYENDVKRVQVGMPATFVTKAVPDRAFSGKVAFVDPILDPTTRTLKVHIHFKNPGDVLKPDMFGEVSLQGASQQGLVVPVDAVVPTGSRNIVFVAVGEGKFEPREVELGKRSGDHVAVAKGLSEGEEVVTRANFLIDSESSLRSSLDAIGGK